jgi:acetyltransferase-like isoleucine patch superfamily enzyme
MSRLDGWRLRYHVWRTARRVGQAGPWSAIIRPELITGGDGITLGAGVRVWAHARLECVRNERYQGRITMGDRSNAQFYVHFAAAGSVQIGQDVWIGGRTFISDHDHIWPNRDFELDVRPVVIGDGCWLGEGCAILKGVELGRQCVVGANAVVTRSAPAGSMLAGVPARIIKRLDETRQTWVPASAVSVT